MEMRRRTISNKKMTHYTVHEWGQRKFGRGAGEIALSHGEALHAAACAHPSSHEDGTNILVRRHDRIVARQMVGMISAPGCSLEILPKVDPEGQPENEHQVRRRLVRMLDIALGLNLSLSSTAEIDRQNTTLLDILIRAFGDKLLAEVRRGLPRHYQQCEEDLPCLRGRLDVARQFTVNAVRPDRLACRFDQLEANTPLMQIMAATVTFLSKHVRRYDTKRIFTELRHSLADIPSVPLPRLPWTEVRIDRSNRRWESLFALAKLLIRREWQATHHAHSAPYGLTLLFPMNDLFEEYVAALLRRGLVGSDIQVTTQGGLRHCLGDFVAGERLEKATLFQTRPDIILRKGDKIVQIIDTKWKKLNLDPQAKKHGVSQSDVYQLMAYARIYESDSLMLLYPEVPGQACGLRKDFGIAQGTERLRIATIDISLDDTMLASRLKAVCL